MGKTKTPTHRIEVIDKAGYKWQTTFDNKPTKTNLETWINAFNASVTDGHNKHLGLGALISYARVVRQRGGFTVVDMVVG